MHLNEGQIDCLKQSRGSVRSLPSGLEKRNMVTETQSPSYQVCSPSEVIEHIHAEPRPHRMEQL